VVTYRDRLCRYGIELFERIFREFDIEFVVLMQEDSTSDTTEFAKDILDVCNFFVAQYNGKKSAKYRALRNANIQVQNESSQRNEETPTQPNHENQEGSSQSITRIGETSENSILGNKSIVQPVRLFVLQSPSEGSSQSFRPSEKVSGK
jgi:hypothetical protein